jgi:subtilisin family serine protease
MFKTTFLKNSIIHQNIKKTMKKFVLIAVFAIIYSSAIQAQFIPPPTQGTYDLIVVFPPNMDKNDIAQVRKSIKAVELAVSPITQARLWRKDDGSGQIPKSSFALSAASDTGTVRGGGTTSVGSGIVVQINWPTKVPNKISLFDKTKPMFPVAPYCKSPSNYQFSGTSIGKQKVNVAILDTGMDCNESGSPVSFTHPNLGGYVVGSKSFIEYLNAKDSRSGHGTAVASIILRPFMEAKSNKCGIVPIKVLDSDGNGNLFSLIQGIDYAVQRGDIDMMNISLVAYTLTKSNTVTPLDVALQNAAKANILVISAAGNDNMNIDMTENFVYPACISSDNQIVVGASKCEDGKSADSNYGKKKVDIFAPGDNISFQGLNSGAWFTGSGTSYAAPIVTGVAAVLKTHQLVRQYSPIKCAITYGVLPNSALAGLCQYSGVVNAPRTWEKFLSCSK